MSGARGTLHGITTARTAAVATAAALLALGAGCGLSDEPSSGSHPIAPAPVAVPRVESAGQPALRAPGLALSSPARAIADPVVDARLLVLSANGDEPSLGAITRALQQLGTPHTVWIATQRPGQLTAAALSSGNHGFFQGVILATGALAFFDGAAWAGALTEAEWAALRDYAAAFRVRLVSWYTYPSADYGLGPPTAVVDTRAAPLEASFTAAGRQLFPDVRADRPLAIRGAYAYRAAPLDASAVPLLVDGSGHALGVVKTHPDGREALALTFDSNAFHEHGLALAHGLVAWVTRGLFLGARHVYMSAHVDDLLLTTELAAGGSFRLGGADLEGARRWQAELASRPVFADFRLDWVFCGAGASSARGDSLTPAVARLRDSFKWLSHTWAHADLDVAARGPTRAELRRNNAFASDLGLAAYPKSALVTPRLSGLENPEAMRAAFDEGVRYVVADGSRASPDAPGFQGAAFSRYAPGILMIPRRPTNLVYDVSTPGEWTARYNAAHRGHWGRPLTYEEILERESEVLAQYMLRWEMAPWMFHQANARLYDGERSLLSDLLERVAARYEAVLALPVRSPRLDQLGALVASRIAFDDAGVTARIEPGRAITVTAVREASVPVTGLSTADAEVYGGRPISTLRLGAGQSLRLPIP